MDAGYGDFRQRMMGYGRQPKKQLMICWQVGHCAACA